MHESGFSVMNRVYDNENTVGFKMFFENGYCISFVFGGESESDDLKLKKSDHSVDFFCKNSEVAVLNEKNELVPFKGDGLIKSRVKPEEIPQIISWVTNR